jgi:predicted O-methyltransferase YrrM
MGKITLDIRKILFENQNIWADKSVPDNEYPHTNLREQDVLWALGSRKKVFWVEVGTMLGGSALLAAKTAKKHGVEIDMICIDPFTGDVNMWEWEKNLKQQGKWSFLGLENGFPTIRQRFLANVLEAGMQDIITPIQATGIVGLKLLKRLYDKKIFNYRPNIIYVDSAHEQDETFLELKTSWDLLSDNGLIMGDDLNWPAVKNDVYKFADFSTRKVQVFQNQWAIIK